jgi:hypothetical protein
MLDYFIFLPFVFWGNMSRRIQPFFLVVLLTFAQAGLVDASQSRGQSRNTQPSPPPQQAAPLGISQVIEALYSLGVTKTEDLVSKNKVQFEATPEIVGILKELGATDKLLSFIPAPRPQPAPSPIVEEPKVAGPFHVMCEPIDCFIVVNQGYYGTTEAHNKILPALAPGSATVQVFSNGYDPQTQKVVLQEGRPEEARFRLTLTSESQQAKGQRFVLDTMRALGGLQALTLLQDFQGDGTLEWMDEKGTVQQGSMKFTKNFDQEMQLEIKTKDGACTSLVSGGTSKESCRGSLKNSEKAVSEAAANFLLYEVQNVIGSFISGTPALVGNDTAPRIEIQRGDASYVLTLNDDKLPAELVHTRRGPTPSIVSVRYSDYGNITVGKYPTHVQIKVDGGMIYAFTINGVSTRSVSVKKR